VPTEKFKLKGEPKIYVKTGGSGAKIALAFCGTCGTALYSAAAENGTHVNLRLGWVNQRAQLPPKSQGFRRSAMPWVFDIRGIPGVPRRHAANAKDAS
jgi:hypothetical protein